MSVLTDHFVLANGLTIPQLGLGTWQTPNEVAVDAVAVALRDGYRHIDTARAYKNEEGVGRGWRASGLPRDEVYLTTKVAAEFKSYEAARTSIATSLSELDAGYIDLLLIHAPKPWPQMFDSAAPKYFAENLEVWRAMEEAYQRGEVKSIGVSNFDIADLTNLTDHCSVAPVANQIRFHVGHTQPEITAYCQAHDILVEAYSPLGTGRLLDHEGIADVAARYSVSVAQICLRYALQKGCLPLPKSTHERYIVEDAALDFVITADDMATLDAITLD